MLVLAGDHVYRMDYGKMHPEQVSRGANMSVACIEVPLAGARGLGIMQVDVEMRVVGFQEKPEHRALMPGRPDVALGSMGIYAFRAEFLYEELKRCAADPDTEHDFGKNIIPGLVERGEVVHAHRFADSCVNKVEGVPYWRDVGTIAAYWDANIEFTKVVPDLNLYDSKRPIWTYREQLPPAKFVLDEKQRRGMAIDSLVSGGDVISGATVRRSVLFSNVRALEQSSIEDSVVLPDVEVGRGVVLWRTIVDRHCRLPDGLGVGFDRAGDARRFHVTANGITLIVSEMLGQTVHRRH